MQQTYRVELSFKLKTESLTFTRRTSGHCLGTFQTAKLCFDYTPLQNGSVSHYPFSTFFFSPPPPSKDRTIKDRTMVNVHNCDSYINMLSSQTYRSYADNKFDKILNRVLCNFNVVNAVKTNAKNNLIKRYKPHHKRP
jgi:hypothetical protein